MKNVRVDGYRNAVLNLYSLEKASIIDCVFENNLNEDDYSKVSLISIS